MVELQDKLAQLEQMNNDLLLLNRNIRELQQEIAYLQTDVRLGNIVSHENDLYEVSRVRFTEHRDYPFIIGYKILKSGVVGKVESTMFGKVQIVANSFEELKNQTT